MQRFVSRKRKTGMNSMNYHDKDKHCNPCECFGYKLVDDNEFRDCICSYKGIRFTLAVQGVDSVRDGADSIPIPDDCPKRKEAAERAVQAKGGIISVIDSKEREQFLYLMKQARALLDCEEKTRSVAVAKTKLDEAVLWFWRHLVLSGQVNKEKDLHLLPIIFSGIKD